MSDNELLSYLSSPPVVCIDWCLITGRFVEVLAPKELWTEEFLEAAISVCPNDIDDLSLEDMEDIFG